MYFCSILLLCVFGNSKPSFQVWAIAYLKAYRCFYLTLVMAQSYVLRMYNVGIRKTGNYLVQLYLVLGRSILFRCGVFFFSFFFLTQVNKFIDSVWRTKPGQRPAREQRCGGSSSLHVELGWHDFCLETWVKWAHLCKIVGLIATTHNGMHWGARVGTRVSFTFLLQPFCLA